MTDFSLEKAAMARGCAAVCGCDEAGAGPLMGPVYAAAVILPVDGCIPGLDDSKKLTEKKREALFDVICQQAAAWAVASVSAEEIDATDILSALSLIHISPSSRCGSGAVWRWSTAPCWPGPTVSTSPVARTACKERGRLP